MKALAYILAITGSCSNRKCALMLQRLEKHEHVVKARGNTGPSKIDAFTYFLLVELEIFCHHLRLNLNRPFFDG